jgi:hypothetical protein
MLVVKRQVSCAMHNYLNLYLVLTRDWIPIVQKRPPFLYLRENVRYLGYLLNACCYPSRKACVSEARAVAAVSITCPSKDRLLQTL